MFLGAQPPHRHLQLDGPSNFRDLGGYRGRSGAIRWGRIYRSDALHGLSDADLSCLLDGVGLRTVIDFRREDELAVEPNIFFDHATVAYHHAPVLPESGVDVDVADYLRTLDFADHYLQMISRSSDSFALVFRLLAQADRYPLVFHCAAGRDRTGVAAALVLLAAGIDRDAIIADYLLSDGFLAGRLERWRLSFVARGVEPAPILDNVRPRPAYLLPVLDAIDNEFGGIDRYLNSIGVSDEELASFRCLVLAPSI